MNTIVTKFGGSSLADANQFRKVKEIVLSNKNRKIVVPSAPGKRNAKDFKITDLLYLCHSHIESSISLDDVFALISKRYKDIVSDLNLSLDIDYHLNKIKEDLENGASKDYAASRGEYLNGIILANYLDFQFIDAKDVILFNKYGCLDTEATYDSLQKIIGNDSNVIIPGF